jgi:hypothetical protein
MNQSKGDKRPLDTMANIAVAAALVLSAIILIGALTHMENGATIAGIYSLGTVASLAIFAGILLCHLVVVARAPSGGRWAYVAILTACLGIGFATSANGGTVDQHAITGGAATISMLLAVAVLCLPLVYMRLRTPKSKAVAAES